MSNFDKKLTTIIEDIKEQKCVLFLGPEAVTSGDSTSYHEALCRYLDTDKSNAEKFYAKDGFFFFADRIAKMDIHSSIRSFYRQPFDKSIYDIIAQLPFHLVVSLNPDTFLADAMTKAGIEHQAAYYSIKADHSKMTVPTTEKPLVFNLFGKLGVNESLLLSYDDLFKFMFNVIGQKDLPIPLRTALNNAGYFLFLGFSFDKWYSQILLKILNPDDSFRLQLAIDRSIMPETKSFIMKEFVIEFEDIGTEEYINLLHQKCEKEGILRQNENNDNSVYGKVKSHVANDNLKAALEVMTAFLEHEDEDMHNDAIMLQSSFNRLNRKINKGIIDEKDATLEANKISNAILDLNEEVKLLEK